VSTLDVLQNCAGGADRFVVVDVETTGVYPSDRVVEVALVTISLSGVVLDVFDTLVQPQRDVSASHIHGITATMVEGAPTFAEIAGDIAVRLHGACFVAHNVPFDYRMLAHEFELMNDDLVVARGIDTLAETGCRLAMACALRDIDLKGEHRAVTDAMATSQLFLYIADGCGSGLPVAAPIGLIRSGRVRRREDTDRVVLPDPPLIVYLASRLPHTGVEVRSLQYLEFVGRAISDLHLDIDERRELANLANDLGLTEAQVIQSNRRYLNDLIDAATEDAEVTDEEYDSLVRVAAALDIKQAEVETRLHQFRTSEQLVTLQDGMTVVFTGDHPQYGRDQLHGYVASIGLIPEPGVTKSTSLVAAADPKSNSGKAGKARRYGIPIVSIDELVRCKIGDVVAGHGAGQAALKVVTCPDCRMTWTVSATSASVTSKRCGPCAALAAAISKSQKSRPHKEVWDPPLIEWLTCRTCGNAWHRPVTKGRKPHFCAACAPSP